MRHIITLSLLLSLLLLGTQASAEVVDDNWKNVFQFQTKMAAYGSVKAQYILGEMYEEGRGVQQNYVKAIEWFSKAEKNGHTNAAYRINQIKVKITQEKLSRKLTSKKVKVKKAFIAKRSRPEKPLARKTKIKKSIKRKIKSAPTKSVKKEAHKKPIVRQATKILPPKKEAKAATTAKKAAKHKRPSGHSYDINRLKGTSLDEAEDSFE